MRSDKLESFQEASAVFNKRLQGAAGRLARARSSSFASGLRKGPQSDIEINQPVNSFFIDEKDLYRSVLLKNTLKQQTSEFGGFPVRNASGASTRSAKASLTVVTNPNSVTPVSNETQEM